MLKIKLNLNASNLLRSWHGELDQRKWNGKPNDDKLCMKMCFRKSKVFAEENGIRFRLNIIQSIIHIMTSSVGESPDIF